MTTSKPVLWGFHSSRMCDHDRCIEAGFFFVFFLPALLSAFLSLHTVSESPAFVIWSAWWYSAHYSLCKTFSESGPQCPYWRTVTKAPLFHVYISSRGSEKQEIQLPLMRKGLHTPLVVLSTWNPGHYSGDSVKQPQWEIQHGTREANVRGEGACVSACLLNSMTNYLLLFCFWCI